MNGLLCIQAFLITDNSQNFYMMVYEILTEVNFKMK